MVSLNSRGDTSLHLFVPSFDELHDKIVTCDVCKKAFGSGGKLRLHRAKVHGTDACRPIGEGVVTKQKINNKKKTTVKNVGYLCPEGNCVYGVDQRMNFFATFSLVKNHYLSVHGPQNFACHLCSVRFGLEKHLKRHIKAVHKVKPQLSSKRKVIVVSSHPQTSKSTQKAISTTKRILPKLERVSTNSKMDSWTQTLMQTKDCSVQCCEFDFATTDVLSQTELNGLGSSLLQEDVATMANTADFQRIFGLVSDQGTGTANAQQTDFATNTSLSLADQWTNTLAPELANLDAYDFASIETQTDLNLMLNGSGSGFDLEAYIRCDDDYSRDSMSLYTNMETQTIRPENLF